MRGGFYLCLCKGEVLLMTKILSIIFVALCLAGSFIFSVLSLFWNVFLSMVVAVIDVLLALQNRFFDD